MDMDEDEEDEEDDFDDDDSQTPYFQHKIVAQKRDAGTEPDSGSGGNPSP